MIVLSTLIEDSNSLRFKSANFCTFSDSNTWKCQESLKYNESSKLFSCSTRHNKFFSSQLPRLLYRNKALTNLNKHGIDFADAVSVFSDELAVTIFDDRFEEERFVTIGMDLFSRILVVVCTMRDDEVRLISARKASKNERLQYEEE
jgi:uncharacterized protein